MCLLEENTVITSSNWNNATNSGTQCQNANNSQSNVNSNISSRRDSCLVRPTRSNQYPFDLVRNWIHNLIKLGLVKYIAWVGAWLVKGVLQ